MLLQNPDRVNIVFDTYLKRSIMSLERSPNEIGQAIVMSSRKILANADNKRELIKVLFEEWKKEMYTSLLGEEVCLYVM